MNCFYIFPPQTGALTLTPGMGMGGTNHNKSRKTTKTVRTEIVHTSGTVFKNVAKYS